MVLSLPVHVTNISSIEGNKKKEKANATPPMQFSVAQNVSPSDSVVLSLYLMTSFDKLDKDCGTEMEEKNMRRCVFVCASDTITLPCAVCDSNRKTERGCFTKIGTSVFSSAPEVPVPPILLRRKRS